MAEALTALDHHEAWIDLLYTRFKIEVAQDRQPALFRMLGAYASKSSETLATLLSRAQRRQIAQEMWADIIHMATNHETRFYRNPAVVALVVNVAREFPRPRILSVGCSTGEEPYSLATELAAQGFANYHVHGTDVSAPCIETARAGLYKANEAIPEQYGRRVGDGSWMRFYEWFKDFVTFEQHNILGERPIDFPSPNVILTQNMLIYYRTETRIRILDSLSCMLPEGGYLITAAAEEAQWKPVGFERIHNLAATVFRKTQ
ncbi:CheR family methyltransferase [Pseudomonas tritici]|uniref:CheR family methyltransferase n=1 Tax=Pseudomonas tritici TaxID=2745518 RepID=UPI00387B054B